MYLCPLWHDIYSFPLSFWSLESNRLKTPQTVLICIKLCQLYRVVWNCISYRVTSCINICSDLYQSNSCTNFTTLSDSFCASLVRSVTVKSNNWNLAWPKLLYTNCSVEKLELYQSLFVEQFIHHSWKILCVINDHSHTFNLQFNTWFYNSEILHTSPSSNHQETKSFKNFMMLVITWMYNRNYITTVRGGSTNATTSRWNSCDNS